MPRQETLTREDVAALVTYDPETGEFTHRQRAAVPKCWNHKLAGKPAGTRDIYGYVIISLKGRNYRAHRLAHVLMTGEWPPEDIDHTNRVRDDNRWSNLRACSRRENLLNRGFKNGQ